MSATNLHSGSGVVASASTVVVVTAERRGHSYRGNLKCLLQTYTQALELWLRLLQ